MYLKLEDNLNKDIDIKTFHNQSVILFGAGSAGLKSIEEFVKVGAHIVGFCDNNQERHGTLLVGYPIFAPEEIQRYPEARVIITSTFVGPIQEQLNNMNVAQAYTMKLGALRDKLNPKDFHRPFLSTDEANEAIYQGLLGKKPFFVGRFGSVELECMTEHYYLLDRVHGGQEAYHDNLKMMMYEWAGFFPTEDKLLDRFSQLYIRDAEIIDLMWCMWLCKFENRFYKDYLEDKPTAIYNDTAFLVHHDNPWTHALKGKKVLVIHPFEESIKNNYAIREQLFEDTDFLPQFELITMKAVQSIAGTKTEFATWFDALEYMEAEITKIDFDIALIGAGGYGFPLGAFIKRLGKKAVHVGGMLQLYFGIKGKAWDNMGYYNEHWTYPLDAERPEGFKKVENGRYW